MTAAGVRSVPAPDYRWCGRAGCSKRWTRIIS